MSGPSRSILVLILALGTATVGLAASAVEQGAKAPILHATASSWLADLAPDLRANADIELEPLADVGLAAILQADQVRELWAAGRYPEAVRALESLEASGAELALGVAWKVPVPSQQGKFYYDVPIGGGMGHADYDDGTLDFDYATDNLFAVIQWTEGWSMNISTDDGASWAETFWWYPGVPTDMAVVGGYAWVGYASSGEARMRRFYVADGGEDTGYDFYVVKSVAPNTIPEVAVTSNRHDSDNRIYMAYIVEETNTIGWYWADMLGATWGDFSPALTDAEEGLDATWNPHHDFGSTDCPYWLSYIATNSDIRVYSYCSGPGWVNDVNAYFTGNQPHTGISAFANNVYCAFTADTGHGNEGVAYLATDDAGGTWVQDDAFWPAAGEPSAYGPNISVRSGVGRAVIFTTDEVDPPDAAWHAQRRGWAVGAWDAPFWFSNFDASWGARTDIEWLGNRCVMSYGLLYMADDLQPYFDLTNEMCYFEGGFDSGNFAGWDVVVP